MLVEHEPRPDRDEDRRDVLDQERDPDLEPVDGEEVRPLDQCERDAECDEQRQVATADAQRGRSAEDGDEHEADEGAGAADLGQLLRPDPRAEDDLGDCPVDSEERGRDSHHCVPQRRPRFARLVRLADDRLDHRANLTDTGGR